MPDTTSHTDSELELRLLIDNLPVGIVVVDRTYCYRVVNATYAAMVGTPIDALVGESTRSTVGSRMFDELMQPAMDRVFDGEELEFERPWRSEDYEAWRGGADVATIQIHYIPEFAADESVAAVIGILRDTTADRRHERLLHWETVRDPLTGALNRRGLEQLAQSLAHHPERRDQQHSICIVDLDGFKAINDRLGHAAGDELLRRVVDTLTAATRRSDGVIRLGGDEFLLLLEGCAPARAREIALSVVRAVPRLTAALGNADSPVRLAASIGVTSYRPSAGLEGAMRQADAACYAAKRAGGGRVQMAGTPAAHSDQ